ncbi:MAG: hypothetical protein EOO92_08450, partial [Pedobacter sp.]
IGGVIGMLSQESFKVISELQIYVKPVINPTLTNFCTELTGITQSTVDSAIILNDALPALESWLQTNNIAGWLQGTAKRRFFPFIFPNIRYIR